MPLRVCCTFLPLLLCLLDSSIQAQTPDYVNAQVTTHKPVLDSQERLLAWYQPENNLGYDHVLHLGWDFIEHKVPVDTRTHTGLKIYLINSVMDGATLQGTYWQHNPAMVYAAFVDGLVAWYPYAADEEAIGTVRGMLDYQLAHGTTPSDWEWPSVPFATSCGDQTEYGRCLENMPKEFYGGIESDKIGQLGGSYTLFYELTGDHKYLEAAIHCADALAHHVRAGDEEHTPWPFRLDARTGVTLSLEEYGGDVSSSVRMFDELIRLKAGDTTAYQRARDMAWNWVLQYPLNRKSKAWDKWSGFFEDIPHLSDDVNQFLPDLTAYYIMTRKDPAAVDPEWVTHVGHLLDWVRLRFGRGPFLGAWAIDEQSELNGPYQCCSRAGQGSHGGRWAAINAMYAELTGDAQARKDAFYSMNYATYFTSSEGLVACCGVDYHAPFWFSDGYADYLRGFNWMMAALPQYAPKGESHILRSSSVVQKVQYGPHRVAAKTFDAEASLVLRVNFKPVHVVAGKTELAEREDLKEPGYTLESLQGDYIVRVRYAGSPGLVVEGK